MFRQAVTVERTMITQDMTHVYLNQKKVGTKTLSFIAAQAALREPVLKRTEGVKTLRELVPEEKASWHSR